MSTDEAGRFALNLPGSDPVSIRVLKSGFAPLTVRDLSPDSGVEPLLVLERPARFILTLTDKRGDPVSGARVFAYFGGYIPPPQHAVELSGGRYHLDGLPPEPMTIAIDVGGRTRMVEHDPSQGDLDLQVPGLGDLEATWDATLDDPAAIYVLMLESPDAEDTDIAVPLTPDALSQGSVSLSGFGSGDYKVSVARLYPGPDLRPFSLSFRVSGEPAVAYLFRDVEPVTEAATESVWVAVPASGLARVRVRR